MIHADGNNIGKVVQKVAQNPSQLKEFSENLKAITATAISNAVNEVYGEHFADTNTFGPAPFRPLIIGGDDITVICSAASALKLVNSYLRNFEALALEKLKGNRNISEKLSACAGIAFTKSKFPFHYAHNLAVELCDTAKKKFKEEYAGSGIPSGFCFHKVRDTIFDDFKDIEERELKFDEGSFFVGPYILRDRHDKFRTVHNLAKDLNLVNRKEFPVGPIRNWISTLFDDRGRAQYDWKNIMKKHGTQLKAISTDLEKNKSVFYDLLTLESLQIKSI